MKRKNLCIAETANFHFFDKSTVVFPQYRYFSHPFFHCWHWLPNKINCRQCLWPLGKEFNYQGTKYWLLVSEWLLFLIPIKLQRDAKLISKCKIILRFISFTFHSSHRDKWSSDDTYRSCQKLQNCIFKQRICMNFINAYAVSKLHTLHCGPDLMILNQLWKVTKKNSPQHATRFEVGTVAQMV